MPSSHSQFQDYLIGFSSLTAQIFGWTCIDLGIVILRATFAFSTHPRKDDVYFVVISLAIGCILLYMGLEFFGRRIRRRSRRDFMVISSASFFSCLMMTHGPIGTRHYCTAVDPREVALQPIRPAETVSAESSMASPQRAFPLALM